ncbi:MAG: dTDP-4-amino-4,6-dideoxygalactose transaminase [Deltaproteobacteria bacterium]|nr:dTDP-4-amino-4,6-dideoxygalactose transaminase [Deltaproteobacteria bacterium]
MKVPFNKPVRLENHAEVLAEAVNCPQLAGNGPYTKRCEDYLDAALQVPTRIVTSATHALEMMALVAGIKDGDEVIVPSFTFVSTANPFVLRGARLRFADNDADGNILPGEVERLFTSKTRAVLAVDYAGASPDLDQIVELCERKRVPLFEDAAQGIGATYRGRPLGTIGNLGCYSFHDTKNITSGEGGALIIRDQSYLEAAEIIREKGTNRRKFMLGLVDKYTWVAMGSSYVLSELNSAYLCPQLERINEINARRGELCRRYERELGAAFERVGARRLAVPAFNKPNHHMYAAVFSRPEHRPSFIAHMKGAGVTCPFHYVPLHSSPFGRTFYDSGVPDELPGCDRIAGNLVRLPLYFNMTEEEQSYTIERALEWLRSGV